MKDGATWLLVQYNVFGVLFAVEITAVHVDCIPNCKNITFS